MQNILFTRHILLHQIWGKGSPSLVSRPLGLTMPGGLWHLWMYTVRFMDIAYGVRVQKTIHHIIRRALCEVKERDSV